MDTRTRTALIDSIWKWEGNLQLAEEEKFSFIRTGRPNCPLCTEFYEGPEGQPCTGCPVKDETGHALCAGTPYDEVWENLGALKLVPREDKKLQTAFKARLITSIKAELKFLRSLLPSSS